MVHRVRTTSFAYVFNDLEHDTIKLFLDNIGKSWQFVANAFYVTEHLNEEEIEALEQLLDNEIISVKSDYVSIDTRKAIKEI